MDSLPTDFQYYKTDSTTIRTMFRDKEAVEDWISDLESKSKVTWRITKTFNKKFLGRKNIFKRIYHCHFSTRSTKNNKTSKTRKSRNTNCPATLTVIIKRFLKNTKSKFKDDLTEEWPCVITFKDGHNHTVLSALVLKERPIGHGTKVAILELFEKGHSVASAYHTFYLSKMEELGDSYEDYLLDRHYFPTKNDFSTLWKANFKKSFGDRSGQKMLEHLEKNLQNSFEMQNVLYKISRVGDHYSVSTCTPIMQRVARCLVQASEVLFVDATSNCDVQNHKLYFFATHSPAGAIPVGCIISSSQKLDVFNAGVEGLIEIMPIKISPAVILTDDDMGERNVLKKNCPHSTLLLCTFHVLKACWKWLKSTKNKIKQENVQDLYKLFRNILMSTTEKTWK
ncbi:hypothetical protein RI129_009931 [Pyrocoelia pectoralis]|uniref:MULE transposase domain-containing protein n=1 Tax=Pyrocoelia pectoralis TaxID=417401 RepID=A0AAN7VCI6_9COLE